MSAPVIDRFRLVGSSLDSKFRVEQVIAEGGFGVVYYATHLMLERPIALKVLKMPPGFNDEAKAAFIQGFTLEAKTIVKISHPNIVQVLDFGVTQMPTGEMAPWMALEWLNGQTLREYLLARRGQGGMRPAEALSFMRPALEALAYAHDEGIAHRDIKPANMMMVQTKRGPILKLLDFGIAKSMQDGEEAGSGETRTASSLNAFSMAYAAPEQIGGSRTGPWTDVHALALIVTEVLTDQPPYDGKERTEICCDALSPRRPTPSKRNVDTGPLEPVLARALALRPADRFPNAGEFLTALDQAMAAMGGGAPVRYPAAWATSPMPPSMATIPPSIAPGIHHTSVPDPIHTSTMTSAATSRSIAAPSPGGNGSKLALAGAALVALLGIGAVVAVQMGGPAHGATTNAGAQSSSVGAQVMAPAQPSQPAAPQPPVVPPQPVQAAQPPAPVAPPQPVQAAQPAQPAQPAQQAQPAQPVQQAQPAQQANNSDNAGSSQHTTSSSSNSGNSHPAARTTSNDRPARRGGGGGHRNASTFVPVD